MQKFIRIGLIVEDKHCDAYKFLTCPESKIYLGRLLFIHYWLKAKAIRRKALSSTRLFGARREATMVQVCHRLAFLGPGEKPPWFRFVVDSPFWGQVFNHHDSGLSSACNRLWV
jgi:hypothetical protein